MRYNPFIKTSDNVQRVMTDVIIALIPCLIMSYWAFGFVPVLLVLVAVGSALAAEFLFSLLFGLNKNSVLDGSAIVTGILLAFTIGAFTPLYMVAFGGAMGVIFGKLLWGGLGRNIFNPALIGREFMTVFFPAIMGSYTIWYDKTSVNLKEINIFGNELLSELFFKPSGAIGEYSVFFLALGGFFLLIRRRISWHIPFTLLTSFTVFLLLFSEYNITFSLGGVLLGTIYMATDMPSSASTTAGKSFYGAMIGLTAIVFIINGVKYEYMSYSILLLNAFVRPINWNFRPHVWGKSVNIGARLWKAALLIFGILVVTFAIIYLHHEGGIQYLLYVYILFCIGQFAFTVMKKKA